MSIMVMATLKLNDSNLLNEWKILSNWISGDLKGVDGFISRDSVQAKDGLIYCILKWESKEKQEAFTKNLEAREDFGKAMAEFSKIVDVTSMTKEFFTVL